MTPEAREAAIAAYQQGGLGNPREAAEDLLNWSQALLVYTYEGQQWTDFDLEDMPVIVAAMQALAPALEARGFLGLPKLDFGVDSLGYFMAWREYLGKVAWHVYADQVRLDGAIAATVTMH